MLNYLCRVLSSLGILKVVFSTTPSVSVTSKAPNSLSFDTILCIKISGAEAPAVKPILFLLLNHSTFKSFSESTNFVLTPAGVSTKLVDSENDLKVEWFNNKNNIGLTAGASAPEILIQSIVSKLKEFGALEVTETEGVVEKTTFKIPKELNTLHR